MLGAWRKLDEVGRVAWLDRARVRAHGGPVAQAVTIDGNDFDDLTGFFCAVGEAVNGPGGYFGATWQGFDDCLFGGFGLDAPCTITWLHSARSRAVLDSASLRRHCLKQLAEIDSDPERELFSDGRAYLVETLAAAERGERTLFEELTTSIESVANRSPRPGWIVALHLE